MDDRGRASPAQATHRRLRGPGLGRRSGSRTQTTRAAAHCICRSCCMNTIPFLASPVASGCAGVLGLSNAHAACPLCCLRRQALPAASTSQWPMQQQLGPLFSRSRGCYNLLPGAMMHAVRTHCRRSTRRQSLSSQTGVWHEKHRERWLQHSAHNWRPRLPGRSLLATLPQLDLQSTLPPAAPCSKLRALCPSARETWRQNTQC